MSKSIRYLVEHKLLPAALYSSGAMLLHDMMVNPGQTMQTLYEKASDQITHQKCLYSENQFLESHQEYFKDQNAILVVRVEMPAPVEPLDCRTVYLCYSQHCGDNMLFTSELRIDGTFDLCAWDQEKHHYNFGPAPDRAQDETDNVAVFYWEMMSNDFTAFFKENIHPRK